MRFDGLLSEIASAKTADAALDLADAREHLLDVPTRIELDDLLRERLAKYTSLAAGTRQPRLASMFVTDTHGTILGIAYETEVDRSQNSAGRNYAYRTYFHGGGEDLSRSISDRVDCSAS